MGFNSTGQVGRYRGSLFLEPYRPPLRVPNGPLGRTDVHSNQW